MPRYLRWIAAVTGGIVVLFLYSGVTLGLAAGTGHKSLHGGAAFIVTFLGEIIPVFAALAVNDWLRERYGPDPRKRPREKQDTSSL